MLAYTLTILYRYVYPNLNVVFGILLEATTGDFPNWLDKLITLSPFVGGFFVGAWAVRYHYESQKEENKTQAEEINKKIKDLSDQHVEEFRVFSEQQLERYDKEMAAKDVLLTTKDQANEKLVEYWREAIEAGDDKKEKALILQREHYERILTKKDKVIEDDKVYIREKEAEMKKTLLDLEHVIETINNYLLREHTEASKEIANKLEKLSTTIDLLYKNLEKK